MGKVKHRNLFPDKWQEKEHLGRRRNFLMYLDFHFLGRSTGKDTVLNKLRREMYTGTREPHSLSGNLGGHHYATDLIHKATQPCGGWLTLKDGEKMW